MSKNYFNQTFNLVALATDSVLANIAEKVKTTFTTDFALMVPSLDAVPYFPWVLQIVRLDP